MNIKALRAFRLTLSEGSLAGASRIMHLSEPAISRMISTLERELGLALFSRKGRSLTPTEEGLGFFKEAGRILDNLDEIPRIAADLRAGRKPSLRVVTMPRVAPALVSPAVAAYLSANPRAQISLDVRARREAGKWLAGRSYDLGIGALPVENPEIRTVPLMQARALAVVPSNHPLAAYSEITASNLIKYPLIGLMPGLLMREQLDDFFRSAGLEPVYSVEVASLQLAVHLATDGAGVTVADALTVSVLQAQNVRLKPVGPARWMSFGILYPKRSSISDEAKAFAISLHDRCSELARLYPEDCIAERRTSVLMGQAIVNEKADKDSSGFIESQTASKL